MEKGPCALLEFTTVLRGRWLLLNKEQRNYSSYYLFTDYLMVGQMLLGELTPKGFPETPETPYNRPCINSHLVESTTWYLI